MVAQQTTVAGTPYHFLPRPLPWARCPRNALITYKKESREPRPENALSPPRLKRRRQCSRMMITRSLLTGSSTCVSVDKEVRSENHISSLSGVPSACVLGGHQRVSRVSTRPVHDTIPTGQRPPSCTGFKILSEWAPNRVRAVTDTEWSGPFVIVFMAGSVRRRENRMQTMVSPVLFLPAPQIRGAVFSPIA